MSKDDDKPPFLPSPHYEVGYGKPPRDKRFRKGQSGNPKGRPVGAFSRRFSGGEESLFDAVRKAGNREIMVRDGSGEIRITMTDAVVKALYVKAAQGSARQADIILRLTAAAETYERRQHERLLKHAIAYKVYWEEELERRRRRGIVNLPDPVPHPNQIRIDFSTGEVTFVGPMSRQEKAELEAFFQEQYKLVDDFEAEWDAKFADAEAKLGDDPQLRAMIETARQRIAEDVAKSREILEEHVSMFCLGRPWLKA